MGFCRESEKGICKPFSCRKADCPIGEKLRDPNTPKLCKKTCMWMEQGIDGLNACKDASCKTGSIIVEFRKK